MCLVGCPAPEDDDTATSFGDTDVSASGSPTTNPATTNDPSDGSSSGDNSDDSTTGFGDINPCGSGRICLDKPPLGWMGPLVVARGQSAEELPSCTDPYPGNDLTRLEGFTDPGPADCSCTCQVPPGQCSMYIQEYTGDSCSSFVSSTIAAEGCFAYDQPSGSFYVYSYFFGTCMAEYEEEIPEIPWDAYVRGCTGAATGETCENENRICYDLPEEPFETEVCYIAEGDIPCPPDTDFQEKTVRYSAVDDSRDCSTCQCGMATSCLTEYDYYTTNDCSGSPAGTAANSVCEGPLSNVAAVEFDFTDATCPVVSDGAPEGEAVPMDPWTYCCAPGGE